MSTDSLSILAATLETLPDPRSKQGVSHPYHGIRTPKRTAVARISNGVKYGTDDLW